MRYKVLIWSSFFCCQELLSSEQFSKRYAFNHYNLDVEDEPTGFLKTWSNPDSWFCYWACRETANQAWVFSDLPKRWKCGIVHLADYSLETHAGLKYKDFCRAVYILTRIQKMAKELRLDCGNVIKAFWYCLGCNYLIINRSFIWCQRLGKLTCCDDDFACLVWNIFAL